MEFGVGSVLPICEARVNHVEGPAASTTLARDRLVGARIQQGCRRRAADHESGGVNFPLVLVTENRGVFDRVKKMGGIVLRSNEHAG